MFNSGNIISMFYKLRQSLDQVIGGLEKKKKRGKLETGFGGQRNGALLRDWILRGRREEKKIARHEVCYNPAVE